MFPLASINGQKLGGGQKKNPKSIPFHSVLVQWTGGHVDMCTGGLVEYVEYVDMWNMWTMSTCGKLGAN